MVWLGHEPDKKSESAESLEIIEVSWSRVDWYLFGGIPSYGWCDFACFIAILDVDLVIIWVVVKENR